MIDVSCVVNSPEFLQDITIQRTSGGKYNKSVYSPGNVARFVVKGIIVPNTTKEVFPTPEGSRATGHLTAFFDSSIVIYTTCDRADGNDISDVIVLDAGKPYETLYRIISSDNYKEYGYRQVEAERVGAI